MVNVASFGALYSPVQLHRETLFAFIFPVQTMVAFSFNKTFSALQYAVFSTAPS